MVQTILQYPMQLFWLVFLAAIVLICIIVMCSMYTARKGDQDQSSKQEQGGEE